MLFSFYLTCTWICCQLVRLLVWNQISMQWWYSIVCLDNKPTKQVVKILVQSTQRIGGSYGQEVLQLCLLVDQEVLQIAIHTLVTSWLDYCNVFHIGLPLNKLQLAKMWQQRKDGCVVFCSYALLLHELTWLPVDIQIQVKMLVITYKTLHSCSLMRSGRPGMLLIL